MKRDTLKALLSRYQPFTHTDTDALERIIAFVREHPDCFERSLAVGHVTASAFLLNKEGNKALLMHHAKLNEWIQLGGHCDGDPDTCAVAIKEAQEESGIQGIAPITSEIFDLDVHLIPANSKESAHYHYDIRFLLRVTSDEDFERNHESHDMRWFNKNIAELPTSSPSVVRMFEKWHAL